MLRKIASFSAVALAFTAVSMGTASAGGPPPVGTLNCGASGSALITPGGIPDAAQPPAVKGLTIKAKNGPLTGCDASGVTGGKAVITGGVASLVAKTNPGSNCSTLLSGPPSIAKAVLVVKLQNTTAGKTSTVAVVKPTNLQFAQVGTGFQISGTIPNVLNKPFAGETFVTQINVDNLGDAIACISGTAPLTHIDFSAAGGSTASIHP